MGLIVFGIGFGIIMGAGIFFLFILPLRRERQADAEAHKRRLISKQSSKDATSDDL